MHIIASELYKTFLEIYYDEYNESSDYKINKMDPKYKPEELLLEEYKHDGWSDKKRKSDKEEPSNTTKANETSTDLPQLPFH